MRRRMRTFEANQSPYTMKLRFHIPYFAAPGEVLRLEWENLSAPALPLSETAPGECEGEITLP